MSKGSKRRKEDFGKIQDNWDSINWRDNETNRTPEDQSRSDGRPPLRNELPLHDEH